MTTDTACHVLRIHEPGDFWFFAYGSLMWNPPFETVARIPARLYGWHRAFCVSSETYRGTRQYPGLTLGLDRGGSAAGLALRVGAADRTTAIQAIEAQEMEDDPIYVSRRVRLHLPDRTEIGYTLVVNRNDRLFVDKLTLDETARRIAACRGSRGTNSAYLANTVEQLRQAEIGPGYLLKLLWRVEKLAENGM